MTESLQERWLMEGVTRGGLLGLVAAWLLDLRECRLHASVQFMKIR